MSAPFATYYKDPADRRDYPVPWADLGGDPIIASSWVATGLTIEGGGMAPSFTPTVTKLWLSAGISGPYDVTNHITTQSGRQFEQTFRIIVGEIVVAAYYKDPGGVVDYALDWSTHLVEHMAGDTVSSALWTADPGVTLGNGSNGAPAPAVTSPITTFWAIGGTAATPYKVATRITTAGGRILRRLTKLQVEQL